MTTTADIAKRERDFANSLGYLDGAGSEIRLHLHNLCDAVESLAAERDALKHALRLIEHATEPRLEDDAGYHEAAYELASAALRGQP